LSKALIVLEIVAGYAAFSLIGAVGVWLVFGQFTSMGKLFSAMQVTGISVLLVSLVKAVLFTTIVYGFQRLHRQTLSDLGLQHPSMGWLRVLLIVVGLAILGQGLVLAVQKLVGGSAESDLSAFDLSTPLNVLGWIGVSWVHGGFVEELLIRGFLPASAFPRQTCRTSLIVSTGATARVPVLSLKTG